MPKKKTAKVPHGRAKGETQISISMPTNLIQAIDKKAAAQNRNRSNFITTEMEKVCDKLEK
ncbi:ribbon-helix-helix protein, CopG family [Rubellicoccus peritrichatus]|uniref:Ribbon-helix-helix protein, CopG family n=1 Tax=Rubellicoccus peritrichatus TaxID=3080537 RepID=A0AAQ3L624_9BACT|nr:ribbon-helix-helix protein, CopG family [Puniceicoccus sp. CR14]WOO39417.1 ribbon-helix-helix protein, CopG family [Puniceicoccus sp. CR14]